MLPRKILKSEASNDAYMVVFLFLGPWTGGGGALAAPPSGSATAVFFCSEFLSKSCINVISWVSVDFCVLNKNVLPNLMKKSPLLELRETKMTLKLSNTFPVIKSTKYGHKITKKDKSDFFHSAINNPKGYSKTVWSHIKNLFQNRARFPPSTHKTRNQC